MLCNYGCKREAKYLIGKNKKEWCCSSHFSKCPAIRKKNKEGLKKVWSAPNSVFNSKEYKEKFKGKVGWSKGKTKETDIRVFNQSISLKSSWKDENNYLRSEEFKNSQIRAQNKPKVKKAKGLSKRYSIEDWKEKYPLFSKIEEMRYNPDKPIKEKEIQVHCKNHECKNGKEKGGWFTPTYIQFYERIRQLERNGVDHLYFYCSQNCKDTCPLYGSRGVDPFEEDIDLSYTQAELQTWRKQVKELDDSKCQICGIDKDIHVHHIIPKKLEPFFALDPDNGICLCKECHYKYGHQKRSECSTGNIANKNCQVSEIPTEKES